MRISSTSQLNGSRHMQPALLSLGRDEARDVHVGPIPFLIGVTIVLLVTIAVAAVGLITDLRTRALSERQRELRNIALILAEQADRTFHSVELVQESLLEWMQTNGIDTLEEFEDEFSAPSVHRLLKAKISGVPQLDAVTIINSEGRLLNFSRYWPIPPVNVSDRDYFDALKTDPNISTFVSAPVENRGTGTWTIYLAKKVTTPEGEFLGLILAAMELRYFEHLFAKIGLDETSAISLYRRDSTLLARSPAVAPLVGRSFDHRETFRKLNGVERAFVQERGITDDQERIVAAHVVPNYPLVVTVSIAVKAVLSGWQRTAQIVSAAALCAGLTVVLLTYLILIKILRKDRLFNIRLVEKSRQLDAAVSNMSQGLCMYDGDGRLLLSNPQFARLYGLPSHTAHEGRSFLDQLDAIRRQGVLKGETEVPVDGLLASIEQGKPFEFLLEIADVRTIRVINHPMSNGGWVATHEDISESKEAEKAINRARAEAEKAERAARAAHERLLDAFEVVPEGLALFDAEDRFVLWNRRYAELYPEIADHIRVGARFEDVLRAGIAHYTYPDQAEEWLADRLARHFDRESTHQQRLPGNRWVRVHERRTADGGSIGARIDITELRSREDSFRLLFDSNPVPMWVFDRESLRFLAVNDAALNHYGYTREQFLLMSLLDIWPREDWTAVRATVAGCGPRQISRTWRHVKADGTGLDVVIYSRTLDYEGHPASLIAAIDITERNIAESELKSAREFLNTVIENVPVPITVKDAATLKYVLINGAAERFFGISRDGVIGRTANDIYSVESAATVNAHDSEVLASRKQLFYGDHLIETPGNGKRDAAVTSHPILGAHGEPRFLLTVIEDLTESKAVAQQLRQAQKMEAVGNMTGGVAHDFNNLLTIIIGNLDLLHEELAGNISAEEKIGSVLQASLRGKELTEQMLAFSRRQTLRPRPIDVNALLEKTTGLLVRTLAENITISLRTTPDLWPVLADQSQLETAIVNIVLNARDACPGGGRILVEPRNIHFDSDYCARHPDIQLGDYVGIEISDTGTGIAPDVLERIFEPFFTTKPMGVGTGLGLSMVYGFLKQSEGHISIQTELGKGSSIRLYLPRLVNHGGRDRTSISKPKHRAARAGAVILAVDDNESVRVTVIEQLKFLGYKVIEAENAASALKKLETTPKIDLLFTDVALPGGMNGKQLADEARVRWPGLKVLLTSGFPGSVLASGYEVSDADHLLSKPYRRSQLAAAVSKALEAF